MTLPIPSPLILPYEEVRPDIEGPIRRAGEGSAALGRLTLGTGAVLEPFAVLRADGHVIRVGDDFHLGLRSTVHIAHGLYGTTIGHRVTVGTNAVVHACTVGDDCIVEDGVCVLDGSVIGNGSVIAAGSVVYPRTVIPPGQWCEGSPAAPVRSIEPDELLRLRERMRGASPDRPPRTQARDIVAMSRSDGRFVAATVTGAGPVRMAAGSSLWFSCHVDAAAPGVDIGAGSNVQDNSVLHAKDHAVVIGIESTIGHNVVLHDCTIGNRVLVGMGSTVSPGTVVDDDVLIAAGSHTEPGQRLESGWLWGGRPARPIRALEPRMRSVIAGAAAHYQNYAVEFARNQARALGGSFPQEADDRLVQD